MPDIRIEWEAPIDKSVVDTMTIYRYGEITADCSVLTSQGTVVVDNLPSDSTFYNDFGAPVFDEGTYGVFSVNETGLSPCALATISIAPIADGSPTDLTAVYVAAAPVEGPTNIVPTIEVAPKYGIDTGIFVYPFFITEAESNYYDSQFGGTGTSHTMTYNSVTYYMPDNGGTHAGTEAPTFVTINGNDFNYAQVVTGLELGNKPGNNEGPTSLALKVDMDEDGFYADVDVDDNDDSVNIAPDANGAPTGLTSTEVALAPASGPSALGTTASPSDAPSALGTTASPNEAPTSLTSTEEIAAPVLGDLLTNTLATDVDLEMLYVEEGTFTMGSPTSETGRTPDENQYQVTLSKGFYLGKYEVTQAQYEAVMTGNTDSLSATPSQYAGNANRPVETVSWDDAQIFISRLNAQQAANIPTGFEYALPTEAQWEYACRAGTTTAYSWGATVSSSNANYSNTIAQTSDVGNYSANPWGFFDMHGNVFEWVEDSYGNYPSGPATDPLHTSTNIKIYRGGSHSNPDTAMRSAKRGTAYQYSGNHISGFRVALAPIPPTTFSEQLYPTGGTATNGFYSMYTGTGLLEITATTATWTGDQGSNIVIWSQSGGDSLATTTNFLTGWNIAVGAYSSGAYQDLTVSYNP